MGVRGLQGFVEKVCPDVCTSVDLKEMAEKHRTNHPNFPPVIVVDAMSCVKYWYTAESWVCGGQWREYLVSLDHFIKAFMAAGIKLVFYFDGVVEKKKRDEWIKRRMKNNEEIARIFQFIKTHRKQPGREMFTAISALPAFTRYALKLLGQETVCTLQEADFEVAAYGLQHNCIGILGQDSDYLIYNTCPYFSIEKLHLDRLVTVMYSREALCHALGLSLTHLPLFACLLGNDVVPENLLEGFWQKCLIISRRKNNRYSRRTNILIAVADYISKVPCSYSSLKHLEEMLPLGSDKTLLYRGVESYLLPGQQSPWVPPSVTNCQISLQQQTIVCQDKEIFQLAKEQHIQSENYTVFNILSNGEIDCSNSLEDECDTEIPGQALIYRPARQHIYSVLLESGKGGAYPLVKEWFVYFGNPLQQPELIQPVEPPVPGGTPDLKTLWFAKGPDVEKQRYGTFLACFHLQDRMEELQALEVPVAAFCCLLTYLMMQVSSLSLEDLNAFVALILCLKGKSAAQLAGLQLAQVDSRAVQLGAVFVRGLTTLLMANSACGFPFRMNDLMPWEAFDGKLFQVKYQQSHQGCSVEELLESNEHNKEHLIPGSNKHTKGLSFLHIIIRRESSYQEILNHKIALLKILLAAAPTSKAKTDSINILADVLPEEMPITVLQSMKLGIDVNRHKEIIVKSISAVLLLLLKHFKLNHIYQFEYVSQHLVFANCIPLILKFFNQNIMSYITAKNSISVLDYPHCTVCDLPELTAESLEAGDNNQFCWRNLFSCINLLRILNKLTKWKHSRTMMLVVFKSAPILKRALKVKQAMMQLYVLKLLKIQTKYLGRQWRKSNMKTMSAIYQKVRHRMNDDWAYGNDIDARPWDFQAEECTLRANIEAFNSRRYDKPQDSEFAPVDNCLQSVLGQRLELPEDFHYSYELWLEREVFSQPIRWEELLNYQ